jgi:hypothetical protein
MDEKSQRELFRRKLEEQINKVPPHIQAGSIQATRAWMKQRDEAAKLLKKPNATVTQLISAIQSIQ